MNLDSTQDFVAILLLKFINSLQSANNFRSHVQRSPRRPRRWGFFVSQPTGSMDRPNLVQEFSEIEKYLYNLRCR